MGYLDIERGGSKHLTLSGNWNFESNGKKAGGAAKTRGPAEPSGARETQVLPALLWDTKRENPKGHVESGGSDSYRVGGENSM
jgi:hypothetical protein